LFNKPAKPAKFFLTFPDVIYGNMNKKETLVVEDKELTQTLNFGQIRIVGLYGLITSVHHF
jgi:hypothetical protein